VEQRKDTMDNVAHRLALDLFAELFVKPMGPSPQDEPTDAHLSLLPWD